jgi:hypothetical protein
VEDMCYERLRAEACVADVPLRLTNALRMSELQIKGSLDSHPVHRTSNKCLQVFLSARLACPYLESVGHIGHIGIGHIGHIGNGHNGYNGHFGIGHIGLTLILFDLDNM